jgi:hypothetical protein
MQELAYEDFEERFYETGKNTWLLTSFLALINDQEDLNSTIWPGLSLQDLGVLYTVTIGCDIPTEDWLSYHPDKVGQKMAKVLFQEQTRTQFYKLLHYLDPDITPDYPDTVLSNYYERLKEATHRLKAATEKTIEHALRSLLQQDVGYETIGKMVLHGAREFCNSGHQKIDKEYDLISDSLYRRTQ